IEVDSISVPIGRVVRHSVRAGIGTEPHAVATVLGRGAARHGEAEVPPVGDPVLAVLARRHVGDLPIDGAPELHAAHETLGGAVVVAHFRLPLHGDTVAPTVPRDRVAAQVQIDVAGTDCDRGDDTRQILLDQVRSWRGDYVGTFIDFGLRGSRLCRGAGQQT